MDLRELRADQIDIYIDHLSRNLAETGVGDTPLFTPYEPGTWSAAEKKPEILARWAKPFGRPGWERAWGVFVEGNIVANLDLRSDNLETTQHRAVFGLGVEAPYRRRGYARALIQNTITWATAQGLSWIDLFVFEQNSAARLLYESMGFREIGRRKDAFRMAGQRIEDIAMTLSLSNFTKIHTSSSARSSS